MEHMEMHALMEVIDLIDDEIEKAEEHLECALKIGHMHPDCAMHLKHADESLKDAEEWIAHKHRHVEQMKMSDHDHHKSVCSAWYHKHPELMKDLSEVKYMLHDHKQKAIPPQTPRGY